MWQDPRPVEEGEHNENRSLSIPSARGSVGERMRLWPEETQGLQIVVGSVLFWEPKSEIRKPKHCLHRRGR